MSKFAWQDHSQDAGFVFQSKRTGATVYFAFEAGCDDDGGQYTIICVHGRLVNVNSRKDAQFVAGPNGHLGDICPACQAGDFNERDLTEDENKR